MVSLYSSLAPVSLDVLNIHNDAFESSAALDQFFISEMNFCIQGCIN